MATNAQRGASLRVAALLLIAAIAVIGASCSGDDSPSPTTPTPTPAPAPAPAPAPSPAPAPTPTSVALTGVVTNSGGDRLPGAIITILDGSNSGRSTGTNSSGEYRLDGLAATNANVSATATFYAEQRAGVFINGTNTLNFTLTRATVSLSGAVENANREKISGATVTVLDGPDKDKTSTTSSNGDYRFESLTAGDVNFKAVATGYLETF